MSGNKGWRLPGGGPWRILAECEAIHHNTTRSTWARGGKPACICPRTNTIRRSKNADRLRRDREATIVMPPPTRVRASGDTSSYLANMRHDVVAPDLSDRECGTAGGVRLMDAALAAHWRGPATQEAKKLCHRCPVEQACLAWAVRGETAPGAWEGIYGGTTHHDRRVPAQRQEEMELAR